MSDVEMVPDLVANLNAAWNAHDAERVLAFYSPEYVGTDVAERAAQRGLPGVRQSVERYLTAFPNLQITVEETVVQDDRIAVIWRAWGKHQGTMMQIPATGREFEVCGVTVMTVQDGKIVRARQVWDVAALLRHIGLLPNL